MAACVKESVIKKKKWRFIEAPITMKPVRVHRRDIAKL
jgi:hypothetical protein